MLRKRRKHQVDVAKIDERLEGAKLEKERTLAAAERVRRIAAESAELARRNSIAALIRKGIIEPGSRG